MGHVLMVLLLAAGCARRGPEASREPEAPGGDAAGDELAGLEWQLALREGQLQAAGVRRAPQGASAGPRRDGDAKAADAGGPPPSAAPQPESTTASAPEAEDAAPQTSRCEQVCEISAAICELERQICGLLPRHPDDERYRAACERAAGDCRYATEACHACS